MPVRKAKQAAAADTGTDDTGTDLHADDLTAAADAAAAAVVESVEATADATRAEDESTVAAPWAASREPRCAAASLRAE